MLTLGELKKIVEPAKKIKNLPSVKAILESDSPVVVREIVCEGIEISVYENGYVLYQEGEFATVFPLHSCKDYIYESVETGDEVVRTELFDNEGWYFRLMLEGEDRIIHNQDNRMNMRKVSYSAVAEDWAPLGRYDIYFEDMLEEDTEKIPDMILSLVTDKQRYVLQRQCLDQIEQKQLAEELGISRQAVSDMFQKAKRRVNKKLDLTATMEVVIKKK